MNILLIGEHYSKNLGDGIISTCFIKCIDEFEVNYELYDLSGNSENKEENSDIYARKGCFLERMKETIRSEKIFDSLLNVWNSKRIVEKKKSIFDKEFDAAIYIGGSIFMGYFSAKQYYLNRMLERRNIPIFYSACGMGNIRYNFEKKMIMEAINASTVQYISLRDSVDKFENDFQKRAVKTTDIAVLANKYYNQQEKSIDVGIGFICLSSSFNEKIEKSIFEFIKRLEKKNISWELFCNGDENDYKAIMCFYEKMQFAGYTRFGRCKNRPNTTIELVEIISSYRKILTCRLHSAIVAYAYQIPTYSIGWSNKVIEFYKSIRHEELILSPDFDGIKIADKIFEINYGNDDLTNLREMQYDAKISIKKILLNVRRQRIDEPQS